MTNQYNGPRCDQAVDIAIFNSDGSQILLGRKKHQPHFRFIGGFSDVRSNSLEEDAIRETLEEACVVVKNPKYIGSRKVDDPRYANSIHAVKTCLFVTYGFEGEPWPGDDIYEVKLVSKAEFITIELMPEHCKLRDMLIASGELGK